jgi:hypothetical protein
MKILIKFPTRNRLDKFFYALDRYYEYADDIDNISVVVSCDTDDSVMNSTETLERLSTYKNLTIDFSDNKSKIEAVNKNVPSDGYDIILLASDDMIPVVKGYDQIIRDRMLVHYPDTDGVLWFNDGLQGARLNTLCILGKKYYDKFGYIYHPEYKSLYADNEFTEVSVNAGKAVYFNDIIIKHEHYSIDDSKNDELYKRNDSLLSYDRAVYEKRKAHNFISNQKWSFCITTAEVVLTSDGLLDQNCNKNILQIIDSIVKMNIPDNDFEIIIIGHNNLFKDTQINNIRVVFFDEMQKHKWITRKKNILADLAQFENCVIIHDYIVFDENWYKGFLKFDNDWDVAMCQLRTKGDIRWRDWILGWDQSAPYLLDHKGVILHKNRLLYSDTKYTHTNMYISGSVIIVKRDYLRANRLDESLIWGQGEDDEWSRRCRPNWVYKMNPLSTMRLIKDVTMN